MRPRRRRGALAPLDGNGPAGVSYLYPHPTRTSISRATSMSLRSWNAARAAHNSYTWNYDTGAAAPLSSRNTTGGEALCIMDQSLISTWNAAPIFANTHQSLLTRCDREELLTNVLSYRMPLQRYVEAPQAQR